MFDAIVLWLHILGAVVFIGPQIFLVAVAMPAMRSIADVETRRMAVRSMTRGFGMIGGVALAVLLATGIWNYYDADDKGFIDADLFPRYFAVLQVKLTLVTITIILTAVHAMYFGRRLQKLQEAGAPEADVESTRRWSMVTSMANLAVGLAILLCGSLLSSDWSLQ